MERRSKNRARPRQRALNGDGGARWRADTGRSSRQPHGTPVDEAAIVERILAEHGVGPDGTIDVGRLPALGLSMMRAYVAEKDWPLLMTIQAGLLDAFALVRDARDKLRARRGVWTLKSLLCPGCGVEVSVDEGKLPAHAVNGRRCSSGGASAKDTADKQPKYRELAAIQRRAESRAKELKVPLLSTLPTATVGRIDHGVVDGKPLDDLLDNADTEIGCVAAALYREIGLGAFGLEWAHVRRALGDWDLELARGHHQGRAQWKRVVIQQALGDAGGGESQAMIAKYLAALAWAYRLEHTDDFPTLAERWRTLVGVVARERDANLKRLARAGAK